VAYYAIMSLGFRFGSYPGFIKNLNTLYSDSVLWMFWTSSLHQIHFIMLKVRKDQSVLFGLIWLR